jgi:hypothetical protein
MNDTDARLWHPVLRVMLHTHTLERGGVESGEGRVQEVARAESQIRRAGVQLGS